ncbi:MULTISPECIES: hypothetical protein [Sphingobium]|uniref:hypothetical protein n=1 Tax=Sphingobium TaxID=165695 RepID=UPI00159CAB7F|nr:hypothetical protein [Sphingobium sp. 15-1]
MACRNFPVALMPAAIAISAMLAAPADARQPGIDAEVQCAAGRRFLLRADADRATIIWKEGQLTLERGTLTLGRYYRSPQAALIIDGDYVSFVPKGDGSWRDCHIMPKAATQGD